MITIICLLLAVPWFIVMAIHGPLALLIVGVIVSSEHLSASSVLLYLSLTISDFFISAVVAPLTAELAAVTRELPGVGYSHVYGAFNLAYGIGSASKNILLNPYYTFYIKLLSVGPILGGQLYDRLHNGWTAVVGLAAGLMLLATAVAFFFTDEIPVAKRLLGLRRRFIGSQTQGPEA